mgnify:CR=1 FL=1
MGTENESKASDSQVVTEKKNGKGLIIGLGKIIPGVSGSVLALRLGIYEKIIYSIKGIFKNFKDNSIFLFKLGIGVLISIIIGSKLLQNILSNYYKISILIFSILIISGIPNLIKRGNNIFYILLGLLISLFPLYLPNINIKSNYLFIGFIESITTIVPGISGTALFISLDVYNDYLYLFSNIYRFELSKLLPFICGIIIGGILIFNESIMVM